jgi:hypothetical protein
MITQVAGVVTDVEPGVVIVSYDRGRHRVAVPVAHVPKSLRHFGQAVWISAPPSQGWLHFEERQVEPFIGPPTREDWELEQWINSL